MLNHSRLAGVVVAALLTFGKVTVQAQKTGNNQPQTGTPTTAADKAGKNASAGNKPGASGGKTGGGAGAQKGTNSSASPSTASPKPTDSSGSNSAQGGGDKGGGQSPPSRCRSVRLGDAGDSSTVTGLDGVGGVSVKAAGLHEVILCGPDENVDVLETAIQGLTGRAGYQNGHETHYVRLFYYRNAAEIAGAINNSGGLETPVKALGNDLLLFTSENEADDHAIHELKRWIALIDVPRPEVSLMAWSIQLSSKDWHTIQRESTAIGAMVAGFNQELHESLYRGWRYLRQESTPEKNEKEIPLDKNFSNYLSQRYLRTNEDRQKCPGDSEKSRAPCPPPVIAEACEAGQYCLGYTRIFSPLQPSLTSMLITLLAAKNSKVTVNGFVDCLEYRQKEYCENKFSSVEEALGFDQTRDTRSYGTEKDRKSKQEKKQGFEFDRDIYSRTPLSNCEEDDFFWYQDKNKALGSALSAQDRLHPAFSCFRQQLMESLVIPQSKALLRSALADFLFHYKASEIYPQDFVTWNRGASAQRLDNFFNPLIVAFNRDLGVYLKVLNDAVTRSRVSDAKAEFTSEGQIMVRVLSGNLASVNTTTQSFFPVPPIFSVRDFLNAAKGGSGSGAGNSGNSAQSKSNTTNSGGNSGDQSGNSGGGSSVPAILSSNLTPVAAQSLLALVQSVQSNTAQIGRDLNLQITANTLSGASSAELEVQLNSQEHDPPRMLDEKGNANNNDNIDRVATHNVSTKVRVDSLKLFDISAFSATLTHGRSVPLVLPFIDIPYVGSLLRLRLPPGTTYHRSFAIVSAVIVPTAADIANAIEFRSDLEATRLPKAEWNEVPAANDKTGSDKSKSGASTTTVQVDQPSNNPITVQIGGGACPKCPPSVQEKKPEPKPHAGYYWIVTHYREGISVSDPYQAKRAPGEDANSQDIQLVWDAPRTATGFDVYRSTDEEGTGFCRITRRTLHQRSYRLNETSQCDPAEFPQETVIYSQLPSQPGNLLEFHNEKLRCIEQEATSESCTEEPKLSTTPVTRFGTVR